MYLETYTLFPTYTESGDIWKPRLCGHLLSMDLKPNILVQACFLKDDESS